MKLLKLLSSPLFIVILGAGLLLSACDPPSATKEDVRDELEDAREATADAQEEMREAVEAQEEFDADQREAQLDTLNDRLDALDERIADLQESAAESTNTKAVADINAAIRDLQDERQTLKERITRVRTLETKDWNNTYDEINRGVARLEATLDELDKDLGSANE